MKQIPEILHEFLWKIGDSLDSNQNILLQRALNIACKAHKGQIRKTSGDPYIIHPLAVALTLWEKFYDFELLISAILHDVIEDSSIVTLQEISDIFGQDIAYCVDSVTKKPLSFVSDTYTPKDKIEKFLHGGMNNIRAILIKLADRVDNFRTLHKLHPTKQTRISFETQAIYTPLAWVLGYSKCTNLQCCQDNLDKFIFNRKIQNATDLRSALYTQVYDDLDDEMFDQVYSQSQDFTWEIEDESFFEALISDRHFENSIEIISCISNTDVFKVTFRFIGASLLSSSKGNIHISKDNYVR